MNTQSYHLSKHQGKTKKKMASNDGICFSRCYMLCKLVIVALALFQLHGTHAVLDFLATVYSVDTPDKASQDGQGTPTITTATSSSLSRSEIIIETGSTADPNPITDIMKTKSDNIEMVPMGFSQGTAQKVTFTACCWCKESEVWPQCNGTETFLSHIIEGLLKRGIDADFMPMPCSKKARGPTTKTKLEYNAYSAQLKAAHARGDVIAVPQSSRVNQFRPKIRKKNCCTLAEESNALVEHALSDRGNNGIQQLQDKFRLHETLESIGLSDLMPKRYSKQEVMDRAFDFPLVAKDKRATNGRGTTIIQDEPQLVRNLNESNFTLTFFEEALIGEKQITTHYMTRGSPDGNGTIAAFWCGSYGKEEWKDNNGLFVLGHFDHYPPLKRFKCNPKYTEAFRRVLQHTNLYGHVGCVDGKEDARGNLKIFDWNARMCWGTPEQNIDIWGDLALELKEQIG